MNARRPRTGQLFFLNPRFVRRLLPALLIAVLIAGLVSQVQAQSNTGPALPGAQGPPETESTGDPTMGYVAFVIVGGLCVFLVCKSSRRAVTH